jgi:hypothetical protein
MAPTVIYDPDAVAEFVVAVKSKEEQKAILNVVDKLRTPGERLPLPHMKPLQGQSAACLRELRPRRGNSDWRALPTLRLALRRALDRPARQLRGLDGSRSSAS